MEQSLQLKGRYNLSNMTYEEEETLMQDLKNMGVLTEEDCGSYAITGGNIFNSLKKQVSDGINLLYRMAIAGRDGSEHIERIKSRQKLFDVLEQLTAE